MNRVTLISFLLFSSFAAYSQNNFSVEAGIGGPTFGIHLQQYNIGHSADPSLTLELNYLRKVDKHVYLGAKTFIQQYSFNYSYDDQGASHETLNEIKTKNTYLFLAPTLDIGFGKRQDIHFYLSTAFGYLLNGQQQTHEYNQLYMVPNSTPYNNTYNSSNTINKFVFHMNLGFEEHARLSNKWYILFNQGFSLFSSTMTTLSDSPTKVRCGYAFLKIGIMRTYNKPVISHADTVEQNQQ